MRPAILSLALAGAFAAQPIIGQTLPSGAVAVHGQASTSSPSPQQLVVTTQNGPGSNHSAINWQSFSISAGSSARINQPNVTSLSINRVVTNTPSALFGKLSSNGRLVLVNPSGIAVGAGAIIDTAGFTASALRMSDADALAGRLRFGDAVTTMGGAAGITVEGRITARDGDIVLVAPQVTVGSRALLQASNGSTILAAGQQVEITGRGLEGITMLVQARDNEARNLGRLEGNAVGIFAGTLRHSGEIQATTATMDGGRVVLQASGETYMDGSANVTATGRRGGQVDVWGERVVLSDQALVNVSGDQGGGSIRIGGDFQGKNPNVQNADKTYLGSSTALRADAITSGDGGRVIVWAETLTQAHGAVSARGGSQGGDGGFAEVSGKKQLDFQAQVDLHAPQGRTGTLLLDPLNITIGATADINGDATNGDDVTGNIASSAFSGASSLITSAQVSSLLNSANLSLAATNDITVAQTINKTSGSTQTLTLDAGNNININAGISGASGFALGVTLMAGGNITVAAPINTFGGNFNVTGTGSSSTMLVSSAVNAAAMSLSLAGSLTVQASATAAALLATADQSISANGILQQAGSGLNLRANIIGQANQTITVGDGGLTLLGGGGAQTGNSANLAHDGSALTSQSIIVNGTGSITLTGGSSAQTGVGDGNGSHASIHSDSGNIQTITFNGSGPGRTITLTGGSVGSDAYADIYTGSGTQTISGASLIQLTGGTSGGGASDPTDLHGNSAAIIADANHQSISANRLKLQGGGGINNLAIFYAGGNQQIAVGSGGIQLIGGGGGAGEVKNAALIFKGNDVPATSQTITVGGNVTLQGGTNSQIASAVGFDPNLKNLSNGAFASIISYGDGQLIEFTGIGSSLTLTGGTLGRANDATIYSGNGLQSIRGSSPTNAPIIVMTGGASGGFSDAVTIFDGNQAFISTNQGDQAITAASILMTGGAGAGTFNRAEIQQGFGAAGAGNTQTITIADGGALSLQGGSGDNHFARIRSYGTNQTIAMGAAGTLRLLGGTGASANFARIETQAGDQFITGNSAISIAGGSSGGTAFGSGPPGAAGNFADIRQRNNASKVQSITASTLALTGGAAGTENGASIRADGAQTVTATGITLQGGASGTDNIAQINAVAMNQVLNVGGGGLSLTGGGGFSPDRRNLASVFQGGASGISQAVYVSGGGNITLQGGNSTGTNVGPDNGSLAFITNQGDSQLIEFTGTGSAINITGGSLGSLNTAGIVARNGAQIIHGDTLVHAPRINLAGGSGGVADEGNGTLIAANNAQQTISAKSVSLNGGGGIDSFALITAPSQTLTIDGDLTLFGGSATGARPGVLVGGRTGASGSNTNLTLTVSGNTTLAAGASSGAIIGTTGGATGLTNTITATIGGAMTMTPSAGAGVRIGSRASDVTGGAIAVTADSIVFNAGDGANNVAAIRTLGNVTLNATGAGIVEAVDTLIRANLLTLRSAGSILMDSLENQVTSLNATAGTVFTGDLFFTGASGGLLTLTGISMTGSQTARITADDLDITGAVTNSLGTVVLRPLDLTRAVHIENTSGGSVLSLSPTELQRITASVLDLGRLDGTGDLAVVNSLSNNNANAGTLRLLTGQDFLHNSGASIGDSGTAFNHDLQVRANRNLQINSGNIFLANNRNLQLYADDDGVGGGIVNIGSAILGVGADASNISGSMDVKGSAINVTAAGGTTASLNVFGGGNQTFNATSGDLRFENNNAGANSGFIQIRARNGTQALTASNLMKLQAGGNNANSTSVKGGAGQVINAAQLQVVGGDSGTSNFAEITGGTQSLTIGAGGIGLNGGGGGTGNSALIRQDGAASSQTISSAGNIQIDAGSGAGGGNWASIDSSGTGGQAVNLAAGGRITVTGGGAGFNNTAGIGAINGSQAITGASAITINGGAAGGGFSLGNWTGIYQSGNGNQSVTVGAGGLLIQGGGGTGDDQDNRASIGKTGTGTQTITMTGGGDITIRGGSSAKIGVGGSGHGSRAGIDNGVDPSAQQFIVLDGGDITLVGGTNGSRNYAGIISDFGTQSVIGATNISLTGGASGGFGAEGNQAYFNAAISQTVIAANITLNGGVNGTDNYARIGLLGAGALTQTVAASNSIILTGGADGGGFNTGNAARMQTDGNQIVTAGAGGITLTGGGGALSDNRATIQQSGIASTSQTVRVTGGGSIALQGGSSAGTNVGGLGHGSFAAIEATGGIQLVDFVGGGTLTITGGTVGSRNLASIYAPNGNQNVSGASAITLQGGANGGFNGEGNTASISASVGAQVITSSNVSLTGGANGIENSATFFGFGGQTINVAGLVLTGGAGGVGFGDGNRAAIRSNASQLINVQSGGIQITGGAGSLTDNDAQIEQLGSTGSQTININSGSVTIQGGSSAGTNVGGRGHGSRAQIYSDGSAQTIQFTGTAGTLSLTGGTVGSRNHATIYAENSGSQTISGPSALTLTGGANGGFAGEGNSAYIGARAGAQTITGGATTLSGGAAGIENSTSITALSQNLTINGDLILTGGGGNGGARIGGSSTGGTSLNLRVFGELSLGGGTGSGSAIGSSGSGVGLTNAINMSVSGDMTLTPSATQWARIGSPAADLQGGNVLITAGGNLSLLDGGGSARAAILSLGDVTLNAHLLSLGGLVLGNTIRAQGDTGVSLSGVGSLTANATASNSIEVVAGSGAFSNTAGSGALNVTSPARWLVYSNNPVNDMLGGLVADFKQYNKSFPDSTAIAGSGNGLLYSFAPTATVSLTGVLSKVYDGTDIATLIAGNFLAVGGINGDIVSVTTGANGTYDTRNAGTGKTVSVSGVTVSALNGTTPVFGYGLAGGTASGQVGTITAAPLTVSTAAVNKSYDATTAAGGGTVVLTAGSMALGDTLSGGSFAFVDPNVGTGKMVKVTGVSVLDGNSGGNYSVSYADNTISSISSAAITLSSQDLTKTYDGTVSAMGALSLTSGSLFGSDTVSGGSFAFTNRNAGIGNKSVTVGGATVNDGVGGANYLVSYANNTSSTINPASLTLTANTVNRGYDGTTLASGTAVVYSGTLVGGDSLGAATLQFDNRNAGSGKTVNVTNVFINDGNGGANYSLSFLPDIHSSITPASLVITTSAVSKVYDGKTIAGGAPVATSGTTLFAGDALSGGSYAFTGRDVGLGIKTVTVTGVSVNDGTSGSNYTVSYVNNTTSSITALAAATWTGSVDSAWTNPANWAGGVVPVLTNVQSASIPAGPGTVVFDASAGTTSLENLTSARPISLTGGNLVIGTLLQTGSYSQSGTSSLSGTGSLNVTDSFTQSGGTIAMGAININQAAGNLKIGNLSAPVIALSAPAGMITQSGSLTGGGVLMAASQTGSFLTSSGNHVGAFSATNAGSGDIVFVNTGTLAIQSLTNAGGNIDAVNTGGITTAGAIRAPTGNVFITANSPLTVGAGGITAGGDIVLSATNLTSAGNLTLNGILTAGNMVNLSAGNAMVQNFAVFGANGVTADAGTSMLYGPLATTNNPPVRYAVAGLSITPPPTILASSLQAPGDLLVTFLDLFQQAISGELGGLLELDDDGNLRRRIVGGLVSEEELCR